MSEYAYRGINVKETPGGLELAGVSDFVPRHTFECGQCFRWRRVDEESYDGVAAGRHARVSRLADGRLELLGATAADLAGCWYEYLDLGTDYAAIKSAVADDDIMRRAAAYGSGIRLLKQPFVETVFSFIISANNNIPRISGSVERISDRWGAPVPGTDRRAFPTLEALASACECDVRECGVGFRDKYICAAAKTLKEWGVRDDTASEVQADTGAVPTDSGYSILARQLESGTAADAARLLMTLPGVGPKVADCILLFAGLRRDVFPKDVWVFRAMGELYPKAGHTAREIDDYTRRRFGGLMGYAQQYLFYWARENMQQQCRAAALP